MYNTEKPLHVLPRYAMNKLVMQEVTYHLFIGLSSGLHRKKKAPWPALPLMIELYEIKNLKYADVEVKELLKFAFSTMDFNPYDPHGICKNHFVKVYYPWIHETFHWHEEDPWRYSYNDSMLHDPVSIVTTWNYTLQAVAMQEATTTTTITNNPV